MTELTPKQRYEERRRKRREEEAVRSKNGHSQDPTPEIIDLFDRFVTAIEMIAEQYMKEKEA